MKVEKNAGIETGERVPKYLKCFSSPLYFYFSCKAKDENVQCILSLFWFCKLAGSY